MSGIALEGVTKRFGDVVAVDDLSLEVEDREFLVLLGPSGCGKSTALRMIAGLEDPTAGTIRIGDRVVNDVEPKDRDIAMVFQSYALYPHMTVRGNIEFPLKSRHVEKSERTKLADEAAASLGLTDLMDRKPGQLSGGQRQRVALGARDRPATRGVPHGRALVEPRRKAPCANPCRARGAPAPARSHHRVRDARPGRGDDHGTSDRHPRRRKDPAGCATAGRLRQACEPVRRAVHRHAADEHGARARPSAKEKGSPSRSLVV